VLGAAAALVVAAAVAVEAVADRTDHRPENLAAAEVEEE